MIRRVLLLLSVLCAVGGVVFFVVNRPNTTDRPPEADGIMIRRQPTATPGPTVNSSQITVGNTVYGYGIIRLSGSQTVYLIPNFTEKKAAFEVAELYGCTSYINGSFYDTTDRPLGLFESDGSRLRGAQHNQLINAFVWQTPDGVRQIAADGTPGTVDWALQTGPLLVSDGRALVLSIRNDKQARRSVVLTDARGFLYFITVFDPVQTLSGPYLADLPGVIGAITAREHIALDAAVNLDGGSASVYSDSSLSLSELTPVGSVFCIK